MPPGPIPKRSDARRRRNVPDGPSLVKAESALANDNELQWPEPPAYWNPIAVDWYRSLQISGQARFYEPSDVALARYCGEMMSKTIETGSAAAVAAVISMMDSLLTSEGARRKARLELERKSNEPESGKEDQLARYRRAAQSRKQA